MNDQFVDQVEATLSAQAISGAEVCRRLGRAKTDGRVRRTLTALQAEGRAVKGADGWQKPETPRGFTDGPEMAHPGAQIHVGYITTRYRAERDWWRHFLDAVRALRADEKRWSHTTAAAQWSFAFVVVVVLLATFS